MKKHFAIKKFIVLLMLICFAGIIISGCIPDDKDPGHPEEKEYFIEYNLGYEGAPESFKEFYKKGDEIFEPIAPERKDYTFLYWYLGMESNEFLFDIPMPDYNISLTAKWEEIIYVYTITFNTGDSQVIVAPIIKPAGASISEPEEPARKGYIFDGWLLNGSKYTFNVMPSENLTLVAKWIQRPEEYTSLPLIRINLFNNSGNTVSLSNVNRNDYVNSRITVENASKSMNFSNATAQFRGRGHGSWDDNAGTGKRGYRIKFDEKQEFLGMPSNRHWVMLACTNFDDKSMTKNATAFMLGRNVFNNIEYSSRSAWADIYINNEYRGVYLMAEHQRVSGDRVDIESEYGVLDTGYFFEYDGYADNSGTGVAPLRQGIDWFRILPGSPTLFHGFSMNSPDPDGIAEGLVTESDYRAQVSFLQEYVTRAMRAILNGDYATFAALCDVDSFVDYYILQELFKNGDAGWSSVYFCKKPGGKLYLIAPWDFDASVGSGQGNGASTSGIYIGNNGSNSTLPWAGRTEMFTALYNMNGASQFRPKVIARWKILSASVKSNINQFLSDAFIAEHNDAFAKNLYKYGNAYGGQYTNLNYCMTRWVEKVKEVRTWLLDRANWFDSHWV